MPRPVSLASLLSSAITRAALAAALAAGCSSPTTPDRAAPRSTEDGAAESRDVEPELNRAARRAEEGVARASAAEVAAFIAVDPGSLARLWSDEFVVTNPFNQFVGKQQVLALVSSGILAFSAYDRTIEYTRAYGDLVIVAGSETVVWAGRMPLAGQTSHLRYTAVWQRHGHEWREVARHANLILPGVPGGPPNP